MHVLRVLGHLLAEAPDVAQAGAAAWEALQTLVALLDSEREESQESAAAVLANLFAARENLRESSAVIDAIPPLVRLVDYGSEQIAMQAARALAAIFCSIDTNYEAAQVPFFPPLPRPMAPTLRTHPHPVGWAGSRWPKTASFRW